MGIRKKVFYNEGAEALEQVAHRCGGCPILGDIQVQAGPCPGQPDLSVDVLVHWRAAGLRGLFKLEGFYSSILFIFAGGKKKKL